ncbi:hypothetical protein [Micromonospora sonneratiae]|uniref:Mannosyl-glycoprotein endo-beta-N-acetylglucosaminidase n=1 Tax=Micromonospora sonneratiae TaxID=1184706 RepID=A0ABW3YDA0_9ACTN
MKDTFSRMLPAITQTKSRRAVLAVAGVALLGGLAASPLLDPSPINPVPSGVNQDAASALNLAVGNDQRAGVDRSEDRPAGADPGAGTPSSEAAGADSEAARADQATETPSREELIPHGTQGMQSRTPLSQEQLDNAKTIVTTAREMGLPERAAVIGVATSLQESKLNNYGHLGALNDHDSQGLFQQRPSTGWGTVEQITNPKYSATAFYEGLRRVPGWQDMALTDAAQTVQVSAYPFAYAQWEEQAADIVRDTWTR